ncbi:MAG: PD-(D/E)XK nuclease domain-containing protein [Candidatus Jordarchaeum sp.]|uniref:PD-(D/E)XK nuclease domain-containing protein n=1 Tax=Candidatus Jordarchaeum sp. TaxID=2823881 RepID=UPI00404A4DC6
MSLKNFAKYFSEKSKDKDLVQRMIETLRGELSKGKAFEDEEDLKDRIRDICLSFDSTLLRDQIIQVYMGAYNVDFILLRGLLAMEVKLVKSREELERAVTEIVSHIPAFSSIYSNVLFLIYDGGAVIKNPDEFKRSIESKSDNIMVLVIKRDL